MSHLARPGTVYLIGAGPGDPDLITVRGWKLLRQAEVVVYDRLVAPELLDEVPAGAERFYVGKSSGRHACPQDEINRMLVSHARRGRIVVRLKGGDPFVFGRGGEEGLVLAEAGIPFEIVPGVTSAISVPAYAGIPVTHRGIASSFTVVTGHTSDLGIDGLNWATLARAETLVILMGRSHLAEIARHLIANGRRPDTPVAVVSAGSTTEQIVAQGTLASIGAEAAHLASPATVVIGEVVRLRAQLNWFDPDSVPTPAFPSGETAPVVRLPIPPLRGEPAQHRPASVA